MSLKSQTPPGLASGGHRFDPGTLHLESCRFTSGRVAARAAAQRYTVNGTIAGELLRTVSFEVMPQTPIAEQPIPG
jgi:hypothetical protein